MTRWTSTGVHVACVALVAASVVALALRAAPRARDAGARQAQVRDELDGLRADAARVKGLAHGNAGEITAAADAAERQAQAFAEWMLRREAITPAASDADAEQLAGELAAQLGQPLDAVRGLLPARDLPGAELAFRFATTRDLALGAAAAGVRQLVFFLFPEEAAREKAFPFGPTLPTRLVRMEYVSPYESHRAFVLALLGRRDRGPFYALESVRLERAPQSSGDVQLVRATVTLRRLLPLPRSGP